jgi:TolB-like protein
LLLTAAAVGLAVYLRGRNTESSIESIAVLPLENQSGDASIDYMSDGLTDSIINSLAQLPNLKVIARSSVFRYKGKQSDPLIVARELGVRAILTGRLLQRGDDLLISTELIDARDNKQIWGEQYERKVSDLLVVQRDIAGQIAGKLRLKLSGAEQDQLSKHYTDKPEAYQLFLQGRFYWNKRNEDGLRKSVDYFNQAIERDPHFALAYAGLADSWFGIGWYRFDNPQSAYPKAIAAATRGLELDPNLAEAHGALAMIKGQFELDWAAGEKEFKLALELNPNYAPAHQRYSLFLVAVSRMDEAIAEARKAKEIDPLSLTVNENVGDILRLARRYDEAEQQLLKTLELDPSFEVAHNTLARLYEAKGMYEKSLDEDLFGAPPEAVAHLKKIYATSGMKGIWVDRLDRLKQRASTQYVSQFSLATLYTLLNDKDKAFECLNRALDQRAIQFTYLVGDQRYDTLRSDPRYADLLRRSGLGR